MHVPSLFDLPLFTHKYQIIRCNVTERLSMRIDPEMIGHDRVPDRDVTTGTLIVVSLIAKPPQSGSVMEFSMCSFSLQTRERRDPDSKDFLRVWSADFLVRAVGKLGWWRLAFSEAVRKDCRRCLIRCSNKPCLRSLN